MNKPIKILGMMSPTEHRNSLITGITLKSLQRGSYYWMRALKATLEKKGTQVHGSLYNCPTEEAVARQQPDDHFDSVINFVGSLHPGVADQITTVVKNVRTSHLLVLSHLPIDHEATWVQNFSALPRAAVSKEKPSSKFELGTLDELYPVEIREMDYFHRYDMEKLAKEIIERRKSA